MAKIDIIGEVKYRIGAAGVNSYISVAPEAEKGVFAVIRQDDPRDVKSKDAIVATRCDVVVIVSGKAYAQVSGAMDKITAAFADVDTVVNGVGLRIRCETPGKVESEDGVSEFWQEVVVKVVVTY